MNNANEGRELSSLEVSLTRLVDNISRIEKQTDRARCVGDKLFGPIPELEAASGLSDEPNGLAIGFELKIETLENAISSLELEINRLEMV